MVRQLRPAKHNHIGSDKAVIPDFDWLRFLPAVMEVDRMGQKLRLVTGNRGKSTNFNRACAVDVVVFRDGGVLTQDKSGDPFLLVRKVKAARAGGETGYPISPSHTAVGFEKNLVQMDDRAKRANPAPFLHNKFFGVDPRQADPRGWCQLITEESRQDPAF